MPTAFLPKYKYQWSRYSGYHRILAGGVFLKHREYICVMDSSSVIDIKKHTPFILHIQKAILMSLEEKKLITKQQRIQCEEALEKQSLHI